MLLLDEKHSQPQNPKHNGKQLITPSRPLPSPFILLIWITTASWFIFRPLVDPIPALPGLYICIGFSLFAALAVAWLIPKCAGAFVKAGYVGRDLLKPHRAEYVVPESIGLIAACTYILLLLAFIPFAFSTSLFPPPPSPHPTSTPLTSPTFPHFQLTVYLSSTLSILLATALGFLDDTFDIRWRHKLPIPLLASVPLLLVYFAEHGTTTVVVPIPLRPLLAPLKPLFPRIIESTSLVNLGVLYYVYMALLSTFTTNAINILAGANGVEALQAIIIASSVILNDLLYLPWSSSYTFRLPLWLLGGKAEIDVGGVWSAGMAHGSTELVERHLFSLYFMIPLVGVCCGFLYHNWYPSPTFPGDTLCYTAGMALAVVAIQAHFSKTLLLFFVPQIFNFILSTPQLFGVVPCPRHRVPRYDLKSHTLHPSTSPLPHPPSPLTSSLLHILSLLNLTRLTLHPQTGAITECTNLTILNWILVVMGPMGEERLVVIVGVLQVICSIAAFVVRYGLAWLVYDGDRR